MASVTLTKLYIHDAADPASYLALDIDSFDPTYGGAGRFPTLAGGRQRMITTGGIFYSFSAKLALLTPGQVTTLKSWARRLLLFRAPEGTLFFGGYLSVTPAWSDSDEVDTVTFAVNQITHSIEV